MFTRPGTRDRLHQQPIPGEQPDLHERRMVDVERSMRDALG